MSRFFLILILLCQTVVITAQKIEFGRDIQPIIIKKCTVCHNDNGAAPFTLFAYDDLAKRTTFIKKVVESKYMPPWKADSKYAQYCNDRSLSNEQIKLIADWVNQGSYRGNKKLEQKDIALANFKENPDITLKMSKPFIIKGDNKESFVIFKIPFEFSDLKQIRKVEFAVGNKRLVHHANYAIQAVDSDIDIHKGSEFIVSDQFLSSFNEYEPLMKNLVHYGGWIPGASFESFPDGVGFSMPKKGVILLTMHYAPSSINDSDLSSINFYFTKKPVERVVQALSIGSGGLGKVVPPLIIPPDSIKTFQARAIASTDLSLMYVWPHMHLLGASLKAYAYNKLTNDTIPLVRIKEWDFNWQELYKFKKYVKVPKGYVIVTEGTYDNTSANPNNPFNPPQIISSSGLMETTNEMLNLIIIFLPYRNGDENISLE